MSLEGFELSTMTDVVNHHFPPKQQQQVNSFTANSPSLAIDIPSNNEKSTSSLLSDNNFDKNLLNRSISDVGRWAYGTLLVEVWVMEKNVL